LATGSPAASRDREERLWTVGSESPPPGETRTAGQRDRDRIQYTPELRRLGGVTQVVGAVEGHVFHNRLTHTLEVAQIARRLAERLRATQAELVAAHGGIDPEVCEAAALAHDLGHPPFGHIAEKELDRLATDAGDTDGFEGNAQSFRILTKLAAHRDRYTGLDLTRATLNAVLKYPWRRGDEPAGKDPEKFGAYRTENAEFVFAQGGATALRADARSGDHGSRRRHRLQCARCR
jgi:dGTPase